MSFKVFEAVKHFHPYTHNDGLLLQFILTEFINTYLQIAQIQKMTGKISPPFQCEESACAELRSLLVSLIGESVFCRFSPIFAPRGCLTKLQDYADALVTNQKHQERPSLRFFQSVQRVWLSVRSHCEILAFTHLSKSSVKKRVDRVPLLQLIHQLTRKFQAVIDYLPRLVNSFWLDENVNFFLLKHAENLGLIYGQEELKDCFKCFKKPEITIKLIQKSYAERGFSHLVTQLNWLAN